MNRCPNCHEIYSSCYCTAEELDRAFKILREQEKERRKKLGKKTVIEEEKEKKGYQSCVN